MQRIIKKSVIPFALCLSLVIALINPAYTGVQAATKDTPVNDEVFDDSYYNENRQDFEAWAQPATSYLVATDTGYVYIRRLNDKTVVYYLDKNFHNTKRIIVPEELPVWGGFCTDGKNYYLCTGQNNPKESNDLEVIRITKYDLSFKKISSCAIKNVNVYEPYVFSGMSAAFNDNHMIMQTGRTMYQSSDGLHHQKMLTVEINTETMKPENTGIDYGWVSHSLCQYVKIDGDKVISAEMGDAYPRGWLLLETPNHFNGTSSGKTKTTTLMEIPDYDQRYQNLRASMGGFELSLNNYLVAGNTLLHDDKRNERTTRNICVISCNKNSGKVVANQITSYKEGEPSASVPQLVKIDDTSFLLLWEHDGKVCYTMLDVDGNKVGTIYQKDGHLSDCQPILSEGKVIWVTAKGTELSFYSIDTSNLKDLSIKQTMNGHQFVADSVKDASVTLKCESCDITKNVIVSKFTVWSSSAQYNVSYYPVSKDVKLKLGQELYLWITFDDESANTDFEFYNDSPSCVKAENLTGDGTMIRLTAVSDGTCNIKISSKWNPALGTSFTVTSGTGENSSKEYTIKASQKTVKYSELKKNPVSIRIVVTGGNGKVTYKNTSSKKLKKFISVSDDGTVTIAQNAKKGTYKIKVTAGASGSYKKTVQTIKIKVK